MNLLKTKDFLDFTELDETACQELITKAISLKAVHKEASANPLKGKSVALIFFKPSTRTRVSFEIGVQQLGANAIYLSGSDMQLGRGESISDTAKVLSRYADGIVIRSYSHAEVVELAEEASIPVINALTDEHHPCQALADLMTIYEKKGKLKGLKLAYIGDGNNVANSLLIACSTMGMDIVAACPEGYEPDEGALRIAEANAVNQSSSVEVVRDPMEAAKDADILYTDVWVSMGQDEETERRKKAFAGYMIDTKVAAVGRPDHLIMHCLPAHRGEEIAAEIVDGPHSAVFDQAENRLHAQKALLLDLLKS